MRYEGESYKRNINNSYPQDLIPCSASTTESLIDLLPLLHQLSSLGCGSEWRLLVFAVNIRIIRKAWANKRDGGHVADVFCPRTLVCQALAIAALSGNSTRHESVGGMAKKSPHRIQADGGGGGVYAAMLVRRAQQTFDATPALLNQSWPRLQRSPFAFAVIRAD